MSTACRRAAYRTSCRSASRSRSCSRFSCASFSSRQRPISSGAMRASRTVLPGRTGGRLRGPSYRAGRRPLASSHELGEEELRLFDLGALTRPLGDAERLLGCGTSLVAPTARRESARQIELPLRVLGLDLEGADEVTLCLLGIAAEEPRQAQ